MDTSTPLHPVSVCYVARMLHEAAGVRPTSGPAKGTSRRSFGRLRRLPSGRWQAAYVGPDVMLHKAPVTFEDEDAARGWLKGEQKLIDHELWTPPADRVTQKRVTGQTFGQYADDWLATRRTKRGPLKPRTRADYQRLLDRHLMPAFGRKPLRGVRPADVNAWYLTLNEHTPTERAHAYQLLRAIFTTAAENKLIVENPCGISGAGYVERAHKVEVATLDELATIVEHMPERLRLAVLLGAWCAMRYGEIAELRRQDLDVKNGRIKVRRGVTWPAGVATVGTPKTDAGERVIAVPPHLMPVIRQHLQAHTAPERDALLFPAASGAHMHPRTFGKRFDRAREAAGRPDLHFHDLRHSGAVLAAQAGATIAELMARLGHSTPGAAMRYQHAAQDRDAVIASALSDMARA